MIAFGLIPLRWIVGLAVFGVGAALATFGILLAQLSFVIAGAIVAAIGGLILGGGRPTDSQVMDGRSGNPPAWRR